MCFTPFFPTHFFWNQNGETALIWASDEGHTEIVKELICAKCDVNAQNKVYFCSISDIVLVVCWWFALHECLIKPPPLYPIQC